MQALIIIALVGFIYAGMSSIISTIATTTVEMRARQVERVNQMFQDVEFAVNKMILGQDIDLTLYDDLTTGVNLLELAQFVPWSREELTTDPWGQPIQVITQDTGFQDSHFRLVYIEEDDTTNRLGAPVRSFALVSGGPDGQIDPDSITPPPGPPRPYRETLSLEAAAGSDDIVHTFSTRDAMFKIWARVYNDLDTKLIPAIVDYYKQQHDKFQPVVDYAYQQLLINADAGQANLFIDNWVNYGPVAAANILSGGVPTNFPEANMQQFIGGAPHPDPGGSGLNDIYYYPNLNGVGVEELGLETVTETWFPFEISINAPPPSAAPSPGAPMTAFETQTAEDNIFIQLRIDIATVWSVVDRSGNVTAGDTDAWAFDDNDGEFRIIIQGNEDD